jgi:hypothetical protein
MDAGEPEADRYWRRHAVLARVAWGLILGAPLGAFLVLAALLLAHRPQRIPPSGDTLLDTWLQAAMATDIISNRAAAQSGKYLSAGIPERTWRQWEKEFGRDPRFWLLCYHQRCPAEAEYNSADAGMKVPGACRYLEQARQRGLADGAVLYNLLREYDSAWNASADAEVKAQGKTAATPKPTTNAQQIAAQQRWDQKRSRLVEPRFGAKKAALLQELLAAAPDEACAHYFAGQLAFRRQEYATALACIERGNQAPHNRMLCGFPDDVVVRAARAGHLIGDDELLTGVLREGTWWYGAVDNIQTKHTVNGLSAWAAQRRDWRGLNTLQQYGCRYATTENGDLVGALVGYILVRYIDRNVQATPGLVLTPSQRQALVVQDSKLTALNGQITALIHKNAPPSQLSLFEKAIAGAKDFATQGRAKFMSESTEECKSLQQEQAALAGPLRDAFAEIARFDYTTFSQQ